MMPLQGVERVLRLVATGRAAGPRSSGIGCGSCAPGSLCLCISEVGQNYFRGCINSAVIYDALAS